MNGDGVQDNGYTRGALTTQGLRDLADRCARYKDTHGDIAVLTFEPLVRDTRKLGLSYPQIAAAFRELADRREGML
jgi:hypothetical protein